MTTDFALPRTERLRLLAGDYRPVLLDTKPHGCEPSATYVLSWSRSSRTVAGDVVVETPRTPVRYLTVTDIRRHRRGGWLIRFSVQDYRFAVRYLRRTPPVMDPHSTDGKELESSYTTSRWAALDELEVVPERWQEQRAKRAYDRDHALRMEARIAERQRWRRTKAATRREMSRFPAAA